jgi:hypothetical protein
MQLKFLGKPDHRIPKPGLRVVGQYPAYVGFKRLESGEYEPSEYTVDEKTAIGQRLLSLAVRDGSLAPADKATAQAMGLQWVDKDEKKAKASQ